MANGIYCIHCGAQESAHDEPLPSREYKPMPPYKFTIENCPGYDNGLPEPQATFTFTKHTDGEDD